MTLTGAPDPFAALVREFELERLQVRQMLALAGEEHRDLVAGETARLDDLSAEKLAQLRTLELYTARRSALLAAQGFTADPSGLAACAAAAGRRGRRLAGAWRRLADAYAELRELNDENSALLRGRLAELDASGLSLTSLTGPEPE